MTRVSVIGCGNMGGALVRGLSRAGGYEVTAIDVDDAALEPVEPHATVTTTDADAARETPLVVLAVKPHVAEGALDGLDLRADQTLVSVAAGVPRAFVAARTDAHVVRVMPNLAAANGTMAAAAVEEGLTDEVRSLLDAVGEYVEVAESEMDVATAVNGSGPAFAFHLVDAVKHAGVTRGLDPEQAEVLAAQTFKGAAETVLRDDRPVDELVDAVCSPGGTTIEGMEVLWESDADETVRAAVAAAAERSAALAEAYDE